VGLDERFDPQLLNGCQLATATERVPDVSSRDASLLVHYTLTLLLACCAQAVALMPKEKVGA